jgi:3-dehydroquinate dehydratase
MRARRAEALAVIGMGAIGTPLRSYLPSVGSRLAYGYLDQAAAPGQIHAADLVQRLISDCPAYAEYRRSKARP